MQRTQLRNHWDIPSKNLFFFRARHKAVVVKVEGKGQISRRLFRVIEGWGKYGECGNQNIHQTFKI